MLILVPLDITLRLASLFILQILKNACICPDSNIIISPPSERLKTGGQVETVQITGNRTRSLCDLLCLEVVTGVE